MLPEERINIVGPPNPRVLHLKIQPTENQKYSGKKIPESPKAKLEFTWYLHYA